MSSTNKHILLVGSWVCSSATKVSVPGGVKGGQTDRDTSCGRLGPSWRRTGGGEVDLGGAL